MPSRTPVVRIPRSALRRRRVTQVAVAAVLLVTAGCTSGGELVGAGSPTAADDGTVAMSTSAAERFGWTQRGGDEFSGSELDTSTWRRYGGTGGSGVGVRDPEAVSVSQGALTITASGDVSGGLAWYASPATTYGRWEFRARIEPGTGYAPAILLWPDSDVWPQDGEIDVLEVPAGDRQVNHTTVHFGPDDQREEVVTAGDFTQWHTYSLDWQPSSITVYLDGDQVFQTTDPDAIPDGPMHLAVQLDVGPQGTWIPARDESTPATVSLYVDWVRLYR